MSMDRRLAIFLLDECVANNSDFIGMTHEQIARYLGTAREVVTRMLKHFASTMETCKIEICDQI